MPLLDQIMGDPPFVLPGESVALMGCNLVHVAAHVTGGPQHQHVMLLCRYPVERWERWREDGNVPLAGVRRIGAPATCLWCVAREGR